MITFQWLINSKLFFTNSKKHGVKAMEKGNDRLE